MTIPTSSVILFLGRIHECSIIIVILIETGLFILHLQHLQPLNIYLAYQQATHTTICTSYHEFAS
ncbi:hypothetical protein CW304_17485 [Bacillus sp. UFRGS-B20]|nr:hypothetical protein CW304_17485 [Bacillus sp. UFRGS-B20]